MIQFETTKATILFVEVPDGSHIIVHDDAAKYSLVNGDRVPPIEQLDLPEGTWQFITLLKDAREEDAITLVDEYLLDDLLVYADYNNKPELNGSKVLSHWYIESLPSLHSLATSLGVKGNTAILIKNK